MDWLTPKLKSRLRFLINTAYFAAVALLVYIALKYVLGWVLPFLLAFCMVSLIHPVVTYLIKKLKIRHSVASLAMLVLLYVLAGMLIFGLIVLVSMLARSLFELLDDEFYTTTIYPAMTNTWQAVQAFFTGLPAEWQESIALFQAAVMDAIQAAFSGVSRTGLAWLSGFTASIPAFFIGLLFTILLSFFISLQYKKVTGFLGSQLPTWAKGAIADLREIAVTSVFRYLKACVTLMAITFVELSVGLLVLRTPYGVLIAAGIAVFDALPVFGTGAIMIPWVLVELIQGNLTYALGLGILYGIVTLVRSMIEPKIVGDKLGLNPIVSMVSIYVGFKVWGVFGMILMPIITQVLLELNARGTISLLRKAGGDGGPHAPSVPAADREGQDERSD